MDNLISKNYQQMISIPGSQNNELNKFFEMIDNLNKPIEFNQSKFNLHVRDENGNSILHRIIINSLNEQELLLKIEFIPKIETLINTINFKQQTPLHLLCKYQYYESYLLLKHTLEGEDIEYLQEENEIYEYITTKASTKTTKKNKGIDIRYDILDYKNRLPLSYLVVGVDIDKIKCKCSVEAMKAINDFKTFDKNKLNSNKMKQYFYACDFAEEVPDDHDKTKIKEHKIKDKVLIKNPKYPTDPAASETIEVYVPNDLIINIENTKDNEVETNKFIHNLILNNRFVHRYINEDFFTDVVNKTIKKVNVLTRDINVDGIYNLKYFIMIDETVAADAKYKINVIKSLDYYVAFSVYMFNKIIAQLTHGADGYKIMDLADPSNISNITKKFICKDAGCADKSKINKETYKQEVIKQYEEIIETKTSLINKVFMDNQKDKKIPAHA